MDRHVDLLVLGGGVIGLACAWRLAQARPGLDIVVVDRPTGGGEASRAAAGMLAPYGEFGEPSPLFDWCRESLGRWPRFVEELERRVPAAAPIDFRREGTILPALDDDGAGRLARRRAFMGEMGVAHEMLSGDAARRRWPALGPAVREALYVPVEALVNPRHVHDALRGAVADAGVALLPASLEALEGLSTGEARATLALDGGVVRLRARRVLVATGAWTRRVAELAGCDLPVRPVKGQVARLAAPAELLAPVVHTHDVYLATRTHEGVLVGATMEEADFDTSVEAPVVERLRAAAARLVPAVADLPVAEAWAGLRPCPADGLPILGRPDPVGRPGLWVATGHFRNGILLTPVTGERIADALRRDLDGDPQAETRLPAPFRAARLAGTLRPAPGDGGGLRSTG